MGLKKGSDTTITKELIQRLDAMDDAVEPTPYVPKKKEYLSNEELFSDDEYNNPENTAIQNEGKDGLRASDIAIAIVVGVVIITVCCFVAFVLPNLFS